MKWGINMILYSVNIKEVLLKRIFLLFPLLVVLMLSVGCKQDVKDTSSADITDKDGTVTADSPDSSGKGKVVIMAYFPLPPHVTLSDNKSRPEGPAVDYVEMVLGKMGYSVKWEHLPFPRILEGLKSGTIDGCQFFSKSEEREKFVYYPEVSFFSAQPHLVFPKKHRINSISTVDDIKGLKIGYMKDAQPSRFIQENLDVLSMDYVQSDQAFQSNMEKINAGRIDALHSLNKLTVRYNAAKLGMLDQIKMVDLPEPPDQMFVVFAIHSFRSEELLNKYNYYMEKEGISYNEYVETYFIANSK